MTDASPTRDPESLLAWVLRYAKLALAGIGFGARLVDRHEIAFGAIEFTVTLIELEPPAEKGRRGSRGASAAFDASLAPLSGAQGAVAHEATDPASVLHRLVMH
ncbi:MAG: hypothetical protein ACLP7Q_20320 [Isosphaeraceae bacterium]